MTAAAIHLPDSQPPVDLIDGRAFPRTESVACPLCGNSHTPRRIPVSFAQSASVAQCRTCRLAYQSPRPSPEATLAYMNMRWASADTYVADAADQRRRAQAQLDTVSPFFPRPGKLLDFGSGAGMFVRVALDHGWQAHGVERSDTARQRAKTKLGVTLDPAPAADGYDAITLWDVVEHLREPEATLRELAARLRPGGRIFLETGNWECWKRLLEADQWGLYLFDHQYYFSPPSLRSLFARCGLFDFQLLGEQNQPFPRGQALRTLGPLRAAAAWWQSQILWRNHAGRYIILVTARRPA